MASHQLPGEFSHKGMRFDDTNSSVRMMELATSLNLTPNDILQVAYPNPGSAWMKRVIKLVLGNGEDLFEGSDVESFPRLEMRLPDLNENETSNYFQRMPSPRCFGTHLNVECLQRQIKEDRAKVIVVIRNPKDTLVSLYHFYKIAYFLGNFTGSWNDFFQLFKEKCLYVGDIFEYNLAFWKLREEHNVLVIFYGDMQKDCTKEVENVTSFLGKHLTEEVVEKIINKTSFQEMRNNSDLIENKELLQYFDQSKSIYFKKGIVGD